MCSHRWLKSSPRRMPVSRAAMTSPWRCGAACERSLASSSSDITERGFRRSRTIGMRLREFAARYPSSTAQKSRWRKTSRSRLTVVSESVFFLLVAVFPIVARGCSIDLADGDIREVRQEDFQAVDVVGFRTGFGKEARSKFAEREVGLEPVRECAREAPAPPYIAHRSVAPGVCFRSGSISCAGRHRPRRRSNTHCRAYRASFELTSFLGELPAVRESIA